MVVCSLEADKGSGLAKLQYRTLSEEKLEIYCIEKLGDLVNELSLLL